MNFLRQCLIHGLYKKNGSKQLQYLKYMKNNQWNPLEENIEIQKKLLYDMVNFSIRNIPYYKNLDIDISSFHQDTIFEDIKKMPFLTKQDLKNEFENMYIISPKLKRIYSNTSGGSTGEPAKFLQDNYYHDWSMAAKTLYYEWAGRKIGDCLIKLWGSMIDIYNQSYSIKRKLANWVRNDKLLNTFKLSEDDMRKYINEINLKKPKLILAYVQSIYEIAKFIEINEIKIHHPKSIMTSAGVLYPHNQELIKKIFKCPVFNRYGSREVGDIGCDCEKHEGLHLNIFNNYIEVIDNNGKPCKSGEVGQVVVTTLRNFTMPLIRYKIGDMAVMSEKTCSCGRGMPLIDNVLGRVNSMFKTKRGVFKSNAIGRMVLFNDEGTPLQSFSKFQVIQKTKTNILMKVVVFDQQNWIKDKMKIIENFDKVFGDDIELVFQEVEDIQPLKSGKYVYIVSEI